MNIRAVLLIYESKISTKKDLHPKTNNVYGTRKLDYAIPKLLNECLHALKLHM